VGFLFEKNATYYLVVLAVKLALSYNLLNAKTIPNYFSSFACHSTLHQRHLQQLALQRLLRSIPRSLQ
jgi:hypothetical protein